MSKPIAIGDVVAGKYELLGRLGEGGMGVVYLAEHTLIEKRVALKVLRAEFAAKPEVVGRFQQEAISASRIKHPNVLDVFDFGQLEDGSFFLAMEYLEGRDLAGELAESQTMAPERVIRIALQMTRALASAHSRGVVHRDLKPENVFLHRTEEGDEVVKIVDFGIAQLKGKEDEQDRGERRRRLTRTGMIFGTPEYMSPEQAAGKDVDLRCDVYAVGVMLYEMLTGAVPFTGASFMAVLSAHLTEPVPEMRRHCPELEISPELEGAVMRALEKDPAARFQSMRELAGALQQAPEGRIASPLGGLLPVPEVNITSFRPARGANAATTPEFGRPDPVPFDLVAREAAQHPGLRGEHHPSNQQTLVGTAAFETEPAQGTTAQVAPLRPRSQTWMLVAMMLLVGAAAAYGYWQYRSRLAAAARVLAAPPVAVQALPAVVSAAPTVAVTAPTALPSASASVIVTPVESPAPVVITIQTVPSQATLSKDGFQVCDATPCTVQLARDTTAEFTAVKGYARGTAKVLAQKDQTVTIALTFPKATEKKNGSKPGLCEVTVDGLKILRPCQ